MYVEPEGKLLLIWGFEKLALKQKMYLFLSVREL